MTLLPEGLVSTEPASTTDPKAPVPPGARGDSIVFIQLLRGLAPLMVMWAHLSGYWLFHNSRGWVVQDLSQKYLVIPFHIYQNLGHLGVVVFFLISGYIITHTSRREDRVSFTVKRVLRIFPMLFTAVLITWLCAQLVRAGITGPITGVQDGGIRQYILSALLLDQFLGTPWTLVQTWTLAVEVLFYALVLVLIRVAARNAERAMWYLILFFAVMNPLAIGAHALLPLQPILIYFGFILIGRVIYLAQRRLVPLSHAVTQGSIVAVLFLMFYTAAWPGQLMTPSVEPLATYAVAILVFIALMQSQISHIWRPFAFLADISYSVYLLHIPVGMVVVDLVSERGMPFTLAFIAGVAATIGTATLTYRYIEAPCQRLARNILRRWRPTTTKHAAPVA